MAAAIIKVTRMFLESLQILENSLIFPFRAVQPQIAADFVSQSNHAPCSRNILDSIIDNGMLWAVPKSRRTVERRLKRKFGDPHHVSKLLLPKTKIRVCDTCGHYHEEKVMCPNCYAKVKQETEAIQGAIQAELGLSPIQKDVIVLYEGERSERPSEYWEGKRIVEMKRPRPPWFTQNLLQKSVEKTAMPEAIGVKPTDLG